MTEPQAAQSLHNLGRALERLREALQEPEANSRVVDGTIQRFEFVIKLYHSHSQCLSQTAAAVGWG